MIKMVEIKPYLIAIDKTTKIEYKSFPDFDPMHKFVNSIKESCAIYRIVAQLPKKAEKQKIVETKPLNYSSIRSTLNEVYDNPEGVFKMFKEVFTFNHSLYMTFVIALNDPIQLQQIQAIMKEEYSVDPDFIQEIIELLIRKEVISFTDDHYSIKDGELRSMLLQINKELDLFTI